MSWRMTTICSCHCGRCSGGCLRSVAFINLRQNSHTWVKISFPNDTIYEPKKFYLREFYGIGKSNLGWWLTINLSMSLGLREVSVSVTRNALLFNLCSEHFLWFYSLYESLSSSWPLCLFVSSCLYLCCFLLILCDFSPVFLNITFVSPNSEQHVYSSSGPCCLKFSGYSSNQLQWEPGIQTPG